MRSHFVAVVLIGIHAALATTASAQAVPLNHWSSEERGVTATVEGDVLRVAGGTGWIRTEPAYLDFIFRMQFRAKSDNARAALLLRNSPAKPLSPPGSGVRVNLTPAPDAALGLLTGLDVDVTHGPGEVPAAPKGMTEWRVLEVRADHDRIIVTIDGTRVQDVRVSESWAGYIGLHNQRGVMEYRQMTVEALPSVAPCAQFVQAPGAPSPMAPKPDGATVPTLKREVKPRYTLDAMRRKTAGNVLVRAIVLPDGSVGSACVATSLDPDLDLQALAASRAWRFGPSMRDGVPVAYPITIGQSFTLR